MALENCDGQIAEVGGGGGCIDYMGSVINLFGHRTPVFIVTVILKKTNIIEIKYFMWVEENLKKKQPKLLNLKLRLWATSQLPWRGAHGYGLFSEFLILAKGFVNCRIFLGYRIERKHKFHLFFQPSYSEILLWKLIMTKDSWKVRTVKYKICWRWSHRINGNTI